MTIEDVLRFMSGVRTREDCKRAWELQAEWLRDYNGVFQPLLPFVRVFHRNAVGKRNIDFIDVPRACS